MKKNIYYRTVFARQNTIKMKILVFFLELSGFFRIPIEVIIRKNFGERYFSLFVSCVMALGLLGFPYYASSRYGNLDTSLLFSKYTSWYIFTAAYMYFVIKRWQEVRRNPSVFDFARFSLSTGVPHPFFSNIKINGSHSPRLLEIAYEPLAAFLAGLVLFFLGQPLGLFLMLCAIVYSFGYMAAYHIGDNFVMDKIDEMILNQEMEEAFVNDEGPENAKGVKFYARKPNSKNLRKRIKDTFLEDDDPQGNGSGTGKDNEDDNDAPVIAA